MKLLLCGLLFFCLQFPAAAQYAEFEKKENGLIYSPATVTQLKHIVDSLNLKFKVCDLHKVYRAKAQTKGHFISLDSGDIKAAITDLENNIAFDAFVNKYPYADIDKELLVVRFKYKNYKKEEETSFNSIELGGSHEHEISFTKGLDRFSKPLQGKWVFLHREKTDYSKESVDAFYFLSDFSEPVLAEPYARMVQYSDCLVDTTTGTFSEKAQRTGVRFLSKEPEAVKDFMQYVHRMTDKPDYKGKYTEAKYNRYLKMLAEWDSLRFIKIDQLRSAGNQFDEMLLAALKDVQEKEGAGSDEFEEYIARYHSKKAALELKRNRIVVGGCSMDDSPRVHAFNIALLSAEAVNWETFLRSHLDIMNDRFERVSDGSYAWAGRKTYIKELETLDIDVPKLLLGISLRIENPGEHHYFGNIGRLGRALAESRDRSLIESKMLEAISDENLDDYNRVLMYYLYLNYNHYLENEQEKKENVTRLKQAVQKMPGYISGRIKFSEK